MTTSVPHGDDADHAARYDFSFGPETPYAHAVELVDRWRAPGGEVVVDLGCGYGAIAEPVRALGLTYLGIDRDPEAVRSLQGRGAEAAVCDMSTAGALLALVERALATRRVAAFTMLDAAEHLANAAEILAALCAFSGARGAAPLVVSIPNVSHRDLAAKLLLGRWDVTPTGLLDETHVRFFAPSTLERAMAVAGWAELEAHDFALEVSDQHFPSDCVALGPATPIGALLRRVRETAAPGAATNQFVRAYRPGGEAPTAGDVDPAAEPGGELMDVEPMDAAAGGAPFLSVIVRTDGSDPGAFERLATSLAAQRSRDFEVVVVAFHGGLDAPGAPSVFAAGEGAPEMAIEAAQRHHHALAGRIRLVVPDNDAPAFSTRSAAADAGVEAARGRYVAFLCEGDRASAGWVGGLEAAAARLGGRVFSTGSEAGPAGGGLVDLVATAPGAICGFAFPRSAWRDMGVRFSDVGVAAGDGGSAGLEEWTVLLRAVELCGCTPASGGAPGGGQPDEGVEHADSGREGGGTEAASTTRHAALLELLDSEPLLLDRGSASRLAMLHGGGGDPSAATALLGARIEELERAHADAEARLASLLASSSWRVTAPLRAATRWWRTR